MSNITDSHIFIHNPKVAGTSMERMSWVGGSSHETLYGYKQLGYNIDDKFKWMFVRNPYTRLVSAYNFFSKHPQRFIHPKFHDPEEYKPMLKSFSAFVRGLPELFDFSLNNFSEHITPRTQWKTIHIIPQWYFCCVDGIDQLDFCGRYENLNTDWSLLCLKLNRQPKNLPTANKSKPVKDYMSYYDDNTLESVNRLYYRDFEYFNYCQ